MRTAVLLALLIVRASGQQKASISGWITNTADSAPLRKAIVTLLRDQPPASAITISDAQGHFHFADLPPGGYRVSAAREGWQSDPSLSALHVRVASGEQRGDVRFSLTQLAAISGRVTDESGEPVPHMRLQLFTAQYPIRKLSFRPGPSSGSDDEGNFRIFDVVPGPYFLMAYPLQGAGFGKVTYIPQFYGGSAHPPVQPPISLRSGDDLRGLEMHVISAAPATMSGRVDGVPSGVGTQQIGVILWSRYTGVANPAGGLQVENDGSYVLKGITPGTYQLVMVLHSRTGYRAERAVELTPGEKQIVDMALAPAADLTGFLTIDGQPTGGYRVTLSPREGLEQFAVSPSAIVEVDGTFVMTDVMPGPCRIHVHSLPPRLFIESISLGNQRLLTEEIPMGGPLKGPLRIALSTHGGSVAVSIRSPATGRQSITVVAAPQGDIANIPRFYKSVKADATRFTLEGLQPGAYKVFAFEDIQPDAWFRPGLLTSYTEQATMVNVSAGKETGIEIPLIRGHVW